MRFWLVLGFGFALLMLLNFGKFYWVAYFPNLQAGSDKSSGELALGALSALLIVFIAAVLFTFFENKKSNNSYDKKTK